MRGGVRHILVVEDEAFVAMEIESLLAAARFAVVGPYAREREALQAIATAVIDVALIDVNLDGTKTVQIPQALLTARIPFVVLTGYAPEELPAIYRSQRIIAKPYDAVELLEAINDLDQPTVGFSV